MTATETEAQAGAATDDVWAGSPLLGIECSLQEISTAARLLGHLSTTELEIEGDELAAIQGMMVSAHADIERRWKQAYEQWHADAEAHKAALAEAKTLAEPLERRELEELRSLRNMLRAAATVTLERVEARADKGGRQKVRR